LLAPFDFADGKLFAPTPGEAVRRQARNI